MFEVILRGRDFAVMLSVVNAEGDEEAEAEKGKGGAQLDEKYTIVTLLRLARPRVGVCAGTNDRSRLLRQR